MKKICFLALQRFGLFGLCLFIQITCKAQVIQSIPYVHWTDVSFIKKTISDSRSTSEKIAALALLSTYYFHNPYPRSENLDTALRLAKEAVTLSRNTGSIKSYNDAQLLVACIYLRKHQQDSAVALSAKVNDSTRLKILLETSHSCRVDDKRELSYKLVLEAKKLGQDLKDSLKKIMVLQEIASLHSETLQPDAEKELLDVIGLLKGIGYPYLHYTYNELLVLAYVQGNEDKALLYAEEALKNMNQTKDSAEAADLLFSYGAILGKTGDHEKSAQYLKQSIELYKFQYGDAGITNAIGFLIEEMVKLKQQAEADKLITNLFHEYPPDNFTDSIRWLNKIGSFYRLTKNYPKAETYFNLDFNICQLHHLNLPYYELGQLYVESGNFVKAKFYLEKALLNLDSTTNMRTRAHLQYCLFLADSATGNYISAIRHLSLNKRYDDTVLKQAKVQAIEKYKAEFETERKDQQIDLLTKEHLLSEANLKQVRMIKNITLYGSLVFLAAGCIFFFQYRRKKRDSQTITRMNTRLQQSLTEKEWLLKEVHHRVKNNLHTIICLLESQAMFLEKDALQAIEKSQHRIYAMSLIHQKLYQDENLRSIDMSLYLEEFIGYLRDSLDTQKIDFHVQVESVYLNLQQAIPVALIINEAVTNSIKYAFDYEQSPKIWIYMTESDKMVKLVIADNGSGFILKEEDEGKSLGMQLIKGLGKELKGTVILETKKGTTLTIEFNKEHIPDQIHILQKDGAVT
jgi:two-component system, sensor histidine kinase PdtaS